MLDLESLSQWMLKHEDAYIITDIKEENIEMLELISKKYPKASKRVIPQIYSFNEYDKVKELGFDQIKPKIMGNYAVMISRYIWASYK